MIIYNIILLILFPLYFIIFLPLSLIKKKWRKGFFRKLGLYNYSDKDHNFIFHCVSVGESLATIPLIRRFMEDISEKVVVSVTTATGYKVSLEKIGEKVKDVTFFPLDFPFSVYAFIKRYKPRAILISETEIWPNVIFFARIFNIPVIFVNGRISDKSFKRYDRYGFFFKTFLDYPYFIMQNELYRERILQMGACKNKVYVSGNIKYDMTEKEPLRKEDFGIGENNLILIAGSTHLGEERVILDCYKRLKAEYKYLKLILAPRHPERFKEVESLIKEMNLNISKRSKNEPFNNDVYLLDTVGELFSFYSLADLVFVGGSLVNIGGHNILEPAYFEKPVLFGKYMSNFQEIRDKFISKGAGIEVDEQNLYSCLINLSKDHELRASLGRKAKEIVEENRGSIEKTIKIIKEILDIK